MFTTIGIIVAAGIAVTAVDGIRGNEKVRNAYKELGKSISDSVMKGCKLCNDKLQKVKSKSKSKKSESTVDEE